MIQQKVRVGLLGVGLDTYWGQFEGLLPRLLTYQDEIAAKIEAMDVQVINTGMVDSPLKANECVLQLKQADVELVFLFISTYALSSTILPVAQQVGKPIIIGEFYQFNLSSCIRQQNSLTAQFVSFSLANLANIFYPPDFYNN